MTRNWTLKKAVKEGRFHGIAGYICVSYAWDLLVSKSTPSSTGAVDRIAAIVFFASYSVRLSILALRAARASGEKSLLASFALNSVLAFGATGCVLGAVHWLTDPASGLFIVSAVMLLGAAFGLYVTGTWGNRRSNDS